MSNRLNGNFQTSRYTAKQRTALSFTSKSTIR